MCRWHSLDTWTPTDLSFLTCPGPLPLGSDWVWRGSAPKWDSLQQHRASVNLDLLSFSSLDWKKSATTIISDMMPYLSSLWRHRCYNATYGMWAASPSTRAAHRGSGLCSECCQADPEINQQEEKIKDRMYSIVAGHHTYCTVQQVPHNTGHQTVVYILFKLLPWPGL